VPRQARKVRQIVDIATSLILQPYMTRRDAESLIRRVARRTLAVFPGGRHRDQVFYASRFNGLIGEFAGAPQAPDGVSYSRLGVAARCGPQATGLQFFPSRTGDTFAENRHLPTGV